MIIENLPKLSKEQRSQLMGQKPYLVWFTGLSGSGKSTLANHLEVALHQQGFKTYLLDGDILRTGLNQDLGFSPQDRVENIRRVGEVARLMMEAGLIVIAAFISPMEKEREMLRKYIGSDAFFEIHVNCPLEKCQARDPKGLYKKVRAGLIKNFTGIDAPYEIPAHPALTVNTEQETIATSLEKVLISLKL
nr:adenylyl-sulfate kinase [Algoriphagus aquimarinus]